MKVIEVLSSVSNVKELIYVSDSVNIESFKEGFDYLRNQTGGNWIRIPLVFVSVNNLVDIDQIPEDVKYIVTETANNMEEIYIFPKRINHDCFYEIINNSVDDFKEAISAGFIQDGTCYGSSETLGLRSRKSTDTVLIA